MNDLVPKGDVKKKLHRILRQGTPNATYDMGCRGVDFDWEAIDAAIDAIPSIEPPTEPPVEVIDVATMETEQEFRVGFALPTNSALPPNEKVLRACFNEICKQTVHRGMMPKRIEIYCKRSGPQVGKKNLTAVLIMKAYTQEGFFQ